MAFIWVVNGGHGPNTPGKRTPDGSMKEYEFNREVAKIIGMIIEADYEGVEVHHPHNDNQDVPLKTRTDHANNLKANCYTSIHANAVGNGWNAAHGIETFIYKTRPKEAEALAIQVQRDLIKDTGLSDRGVKSADFHELRETHMTSILIECGFMTNQAEAALLKSMDYRWKVARAIVKAHAAFYGWKKKEVIPPPAPKQTPAPSNTIYRVQVGAFGNRENADRLVAELKEKGYSAIITQ